MHKKPRLKSKRKMSSFAKKIAKRQIQDDIFKEKMSKIYRETPSATRWCKECADWTVAKCLLNGTFAPCAVCVEKKNKEIADQKEMVRRAEMYRKATPVAAGKSFAEMMCDC